MKTEDRIDLAYSIGTILVFLVILPTGIFLELYCYNNLLRPLFTELPVLSLAQFWSVNLGLGIIFCRHTYQELTDEQQFKKACERLGGIVVAWVMAYVTVNFIL